MDKLSILNGLALKDFWSEHCYWKMQIVHNPDEDTIAKIFIYDALQTDREKQQQTKILLPPELTGDETQLLEPFLFSKAVVRRGVCFREMQQLWGEGKETLYSRPLFIKEADPGPETPQKSQSVVPSTKKKRRRQQPAGSFKTPDRKTKKGNGDSPGSPESSTQATPQASARSNPPPGSAEL